MLWFPIALTTAFSSAATDALIKAYMGSLGTFNMVLGRVISPIIFLLPVLFMQKWPHLDFLFWKTLVIMLPLETLALILYMEAIRVSPLSLTVPFLAFTPAFMIITGRIILGEQLKAGGILGIFMIVIGGYSLHLKSIGKGWLAPLQAVIKEKGSVLMLGVSLIYSVNAVLGKLAIHHSTPLFFGAFYFIVHGIFASLVLALFFQAYPWDVMRRAPKGVLFTGLAQSIMILTHTWAISLAPAAYMIAVKRMSVLFGVLMGCIFFKEKELASRLLGAVLMVAGVFIIASS